MTIQEIKKMYPGVNLGQALSCCTKYNLLYIVNPKSACSSVKLLLSRLQIDDHEFDSENLHIKGGNPLPVPSDIGWSTVEKNLTSPSDYFKFSFVRDPLSRIISCYNDKIIGEDILFLPELKKEPGFEGIDNFNLSFSEFLNILLNQSLHAMNQHWRPQSYNLMVDAIDFDFIGKIEQFDTDFDKVMQAVDGPKLSSVRKNKSDNKSNQFTIADVTEKDFQIVTELYRKDFEYFDYSLDDHAVHNHLNAA